MMWEPTDIFDVKKRFLVTLNFVNHNQGSGVRQAGLKSALTRCVTSGSFSCLGFVTCDWV